MTKVGEIFYVLFFAILSIIGMFVLFLLYHEREHKKEKICKTRSETDSVGQHDKSVHDVTFGPSTASRTPTETTKTKGSI